MDYNLSLDLHEFLVIDSCVEESFRSYRVAYCHNRLKGHKFDFFINRLVPLFERLESIRLDRPVKYDLMTGEHYDV